MRDKEKTKEDLQRELKELRDRLSNTERLGSQYKRPESRFSGLLEAAPDAIIIVDQRGRVVLVNAQVEKLFGYAREELLGQPIETLIPDRFRKAHQKHRKGYTSDPRARPMGIGLDLAGRRKGGEEFPVEISLSPLETEEGALIISIIRDLTGHKRMESALRESRERLQAILDNTTSVIYAKDPEGRYFLVNRQCETIFHLSSGETAGKTDFDLFPKEVAEAIRENDRRVLDANSPMEFEEILPHDGRPHTYLSVKFPLKDAHGHPYSVCGVLTDITERKRVEEELGVQKALLEKKVREMDDFIHVVSHDLKEPLRGMEAFAGFLMEDYAPLLDEDGKRYIRYLKQSAVRMKDLIQDLLTLASISRKDPTPQKVDLNHILDLVKQDLEFGIGQKKAEVSALSPLPLVWVDPTRIGEVFRNLVSNGIKFNLSETPKVEIDVREEGADYLFSVKDNGIGIDPRYKELIFGLFERLHPQEVFEGTGAGLAICKKVVEGIGGKIWVQSTPGEGSVFFFTLPKGEAKSDAGPLKTKTEKG